MIKTIKEIENEYLEELEESTYDSIEYTLEGMLNYFGKPSVSIMFLIEKLNAYKLATNDPVISSDNEENQKKITDFLDEQNFLYQWNIAVKRLSSTGYAVFTLDKINDEWLLILGNTLIAPKRKGNGKYIEGNVLSAIIKGQKDIFIIQSTYTTTGIYRSAYSKPSENANSLSPSEEINSMEKTTLEKMRQETGMFVKPFVSHKDIGEPLFETFEAQLSSNPNMVLIGESDLQDLTQDLMLLDFTFAKSMLSLFVEQSRIFINSGFGDDSDEMQNNTELQKFIKAGIINLFESTMNASGKDRYGKMDANFQVISESYKLYIQQFEIVLEKVGFKRATQVKSAQQSSKEAAQNADSENAALENKQQRLQKKLKSLIKKISRVALDIEDETISVNLQKLDIQDDHEKALELIQMFQTGLVSRANAIEKIENIPTDEAEIKAKEIEEEQKKIMEMGQQEQGGGFGSKMFGGGKSKVADNPDKEKKNEARRKSFKETGK